MAHRVNDNAGEEILEPLLSQGMAGMPEVLTRLTNQAADSDTKCNLISK